MPLPSLAQYPQKGKILVIFEKNFFTMNYRKILLSTAILAFSFHHAQNLKLNPTSAEERWKGYEQRKKLEENSIFKNLNFRKNIYEIVIIVYFCPTINYKHNKNII